MSLPVVTCSYHVSFYEILSREILSSGYIKPVLCILLIMYSSKKVCFITEVSSIDADNISFDVWQIFQWAF